PCTPTHDSSTAAGWAARGHGTHHATLFGLFRTCDTVGDPLSGCFMVSKGVCRIVHLRHFAVCSPAVCDTTGHGGHPMAHQALHSRYPPLQQDIICAEPAIATLPATVDALGASRAMITCGPTILRACNVVPRVQEALGSRYVGVYAGVAPHAPVETVEEGVAMAQEVQPDVFI